MYAPPLRVKVRVPSKVNLFLSVRGRRPDGFHELVTILQTLSIHDTVVARLDGSGASAHPAARRFMALRFTHDAAADVPADERNLAVRAAHRLMHEVGMGSGDAGGVGSRDAPVTELHLSKQIPVAAGMAGGSADAAAALVALNHLWDADLDRSALGRLAADVGSDVPFCVLGGTALATGTGTATAQVLTRGTYHWVVGVNEDPLATPEVYRAFDDLQDPGEHEPDAVLQALRTGDAEALGAALHNDLQQAAIALRPELADQLEAMVDGGALGAIVSGSGPTVVALVGSAQDAATLAHLVAGDFDRVETAFSPAGGPELLVS